MSLLIPPLLAISLPTGNAEGSTSLFGGQGQAPQLGAGAGQDFLAVVSTLTSLTAPPIAPAIQTLAPEGNELLGETQVGGDNTADIAALLNQLRALQGEGVPQISGEGNAQQTITAIFNDADINVAVQSPLSTQPLPLQVQPQGEGQAIVNQIQSSVQSLLSSIIQQDGLGNAPVTQPDLFVTQQPVVVGPVAGIPVISSESDVGQIVLPANFVPTSEGGQGIIALPSTLKVTDTPSQSGFDAPANAGTNIQAQNIAALLQNAVLNQVVGNNAPSDTQTNQTQAITAATVESSEDQLISQVAPLLAGNTHVKSTDGKNGQQNATTPIIVPSDTGNQSTITPQIQNQLPVNVQPTAFSTKVTVSSDVGVFDQVKTSLLPQHQAAPTTTQPDVSGAFSSLLSVGQIGSDRISSQIAANAPSVVDQVVVRVAHALKDDSKKITIHLEPASLGKVDVRLDFSHDGKTHVSILVDRAETLELLQRDAKQLQTALNDVGVKADAGSLNFSMRDGGGQQGRFGDAQQGYSQYANSQVPTEDKAILEEIQLYLGGGSSVQGIDIRV